MLRKYFGFIFIILISIIPLLSLLHPGLPLTHDGQDHVARIANFYQSLSEGNLIPRWAGNLNWGYGHPILMFLYPLPSYAASAFHFIGFSLVDSVKIVFAIAFILSGVAMYLWLREFLGEQAAVAGVILYNFAPYRFVDLYVRGAIGEHVAFIFPPLILYFLLKISKLPPPRSKGLHLGGAWFAGACFSIAGLIISHNAISIMFLPFIIAYALYLIFNSNKRLSLIYQYLAILVLGLFLSSFFLIPAFLEGKYTLRDIVTNGEALNRFVDFKNLIWSSWNYGQSGEFSVQVGLLSWLAVIAGSISFWFYKKNKNLQILILATLLYFIISIFIMLPESKFLWQHFTILQKFQFPWRFLSISLFSAAVLGAFAVSSINSKKIQAAILILIITLSLALTFDYWKSRGYLLKSESFFSSVYNGTTDTGESSPIWSVRFMEHAPYASAEVIEGAASIKSILRTSTHHKYEITADFHSRIRENTLYFPGWRVYIDRKQYESVQFQDPANRGLITFYVPAGKHIVDVKFGDTKLRSISNYISLAALFIIVGIIFNTFGSVYKRQ